MVLMTLKLTGMVKSVAVSSDERRIASADDHSVRVWSTSTGVELSVLSGHTDRASSVVFSMDDSWIVSGSFDKSMRVWDAATEEILRVLEGHIERVHSVAVSGQGRIVSGSQNKMVRVWDGFTGEALKMMDGHTKWVSSVAFSRDGNQIASGSLDMSCGYGMHRRVTYSRC